LNTRFSWKAWSAPPYMLAPFVCIDTGIVIMDATLAGVNVRPTALPNLVSVAPG
jgi:hypothetical protein